MATGKYTLKFERFQVLQEWKDGQVQEELKEMRKLVGELSKQLSSSSQDGAAQFIPMRKIKQALAKLTDNAAVLIQGEPPSKLLCYSSSSAGCTFVVCVLCCWVIRLVRNGVG